MAVIQVERFGGLAGFGGGGARIRSRGQIDTSLLSASETEAVDALFRGQGATEAPGNADRFRVELTRSTADGTETVVVPEADIPAKVAACLKDEFV